MHRRRVNEFAIAIVIALAAVLVFHNSLHNTFALDDFYRVVDNPGIQQFWPPWRHFLDPRTSSTLDRLAQYRPLLPLTLSINYALTGNSAVGFHLGNLFAQIVASVLAFALCLELLRHWSARRWSDTQQLLIAGFAALLFAVHPVSGIAVNYISARDLLLMQCFFLAALLAYARMRRLGTTPLRWGVALALLALSLLAKTNLVVAPLLVLAFDLIVARDPVRSRGVWLRALTAGAVVIAFFVVTRVVLGFSDLEQVVAGNGSALRYGATQAALQLFHYLPHFWWPFSIRQLPLVSSVAFSDYRVWLGLGFIAATIVVAWRARRFAPLLAFCVFAYWILLLPESSILPFHHLAVDYRPYPGSVFLFLLVATLAVQTLGTRRGALALGVVTAYAGATSIALNRNWQSGTTLWSHSVAYGGDAVAHLNLALSLGDRNDMRVRQHLEEALRINPNYVLAHINLCLLQLDLGETRAGVERCEYAVRIEPNWSQSHYWLASAYRRTGRLNEAAAASARAAVLDKANVEYAYQAALDAEAVGDWAAALEFANQARARAPEYKELGFVRGFALQKLGRNQEALDDYNAFLRSHPTHAQVLFNSGYALMTMGRCFEALRYFERTVALRPGYSEAREHLERCRSQVK